MKLTIENTTKIVELESRRNRPIVCRIWEGHDENGTPVHLIVARVGVHKDLPDAAHERFRRELTETAAPPSAEVGKAYDLRYFID